MNEPVVHRLRELIDVFMRDGVAFTAKDVCDGLREEFGPNVEIPYQECLHQTLSYVQQNGLRYNYAAVPATTLATNKVVWLFSRHTGNNTAVGSVTESNAARIRQAAHDYLAELYKSFPCFTVLDVLRRAGVAHTVRPQLISSLVVDLVYKESELLGVPVLVKPGVTGEGNHRFVILVHRTGSGLDRLSQFLNERVTKLQLIPLVEIHNLFNVLAGDLPGLISTCLYLIHRMDTEHSVGYVYSELTESLHPEASSLVLFVAERIAQLEHPDGGWFETDIFLRRLREEFREQFEYCPSIEVLRMALIQAGFNIIERAQAACGKNLTITLSGTATRIGPYRSKNLNRSYRRTIENTIADFLADSTAELSDKSFIEAVGASGRLLDSDWSWRGQALRDLHRLATFRGVPTSIRVFEDGSFFATHTDAPNLAVAFESDRLTEVQDKLEVAINSAVERSSQNLKVPVPVQDFINQLDPSGKHTDLARGEILALIDAIVLKRNDISRGFSLRLSAHHDPYLVMYVDPVEEHRDRKRDVKRYLLSNHEQLTQNGSEGVIPLSTMLVDLRSDTLYRWKDTTQAELSGIVGEVLAEDFVNRVSLNNSILLEIDSDGEKYVCLQPGVAPYKFPYLANLKEIVSELVRDRNNFDAELVRLRLRDSYRPAHINDGQLPIQIQGIVEELGVPYTAISGLDGHDGPQFQPFVEPKVNEHEHYRSELSHEVQKLIGMRQSFSVDDIRSQIRDIGYQPVINDEFIDLIVGAAREHAALTDIGYTVFLGPVPFEHSSIFIPTDSVHKHILLAEQYRATIEKYVRDRAAVNGFANNETKPQNFSIEGLRSRIWRAHGVHISHYDLLGVVVDTLHRFKADRYDLAIDHNNNRCLAMEVYRTPVHHRYQDIIDKSLDHVVQTGADLSVRALRDKIRYERAASIKDGFFPAVVSQYFSKLLTEKKFGAGLDMSVIHRTSCGRPECDDDRCQDVVIAPTVRANRYRRFLPKLFSKLFRRKEK